MILALFRKLKDEIQHEKIHASLLHVAHYSYYLSLKSQSKKGEVLVPLLLVQISALLLDPKRPDVLHGEQSTP